MAQATMVLRVNNGRVRGKPIFIRDSHFRPIAAEAPQQNDRRYTASGYDIRSRFSCFQRYDFGLFNFAKGESGEVLHISGPNGLRPRRRCKHL
jgi:hypothetical protein